MHVCMHICCCECMSHVCCLPHQVKECPELDCDQSRQRTVPGECCPRCIGKQTMLTKGA